MHGQQHPPLPQPQPQLTAAEQAELDAIKAEQLEEAREWPPVFTPDSTNMHRSELTARATTTVTAMDTPGPIPLPPQDGAGNPIPALTAFTDPLVAEHAALRALADYLPAVE